MLKVNFKFLPNQTVCINMRDNIQESIRDLNKDVTLGARHLPINTFSTYILTLFPLAQKSLKLFTVLLSNYHTLHNVADQTSCYQLLSYVQESCVVIVRIHAYEEGKDDDFIMLMKNKKIKSKSY
jgi:hypothetical protein